MRTTLTPKRVPALATLLLLSWPGLASACAVCFGDPESSQTQGMNMAILTMLGVTAFVLGSIATTALVLLHRASREETAASDSSVVDEYPGLAAGPITEGPA